VARLVEPAAGRAGVVTTLLKFVHIAAIGVWSGGLIILPYLFWQRRLLGAGGYELDRLARMTRFVYVVMTSPAAFVAIGSGTALIFLQATFAEWFSLKLALVGALVMLHVIAGLIGAGLFTGKGRFGIAAHVTLSSLYLVVIVAIFWVVLAKPQIDSTAFATEAFQPGALGQFFRATSSPIP
jgi:uncharacterized membrane protein